MAWQLKYSLLKIEFNSRKSVLSVVYTECASYNITNINCYLEFETNRGLCGIYFDLKQLCIFSFECVCLYLGNIHKFSILTTYSI